SSYRGLVFHSDGARRRTETRLWDEPDANEAETPPRQAPRWLTLVGSIRAVRMELKRRAPERLIGLAGNPAAPESAIRVAELRLGQQLPPSYRQFLAWSDGWPAFFENASLLGTSEIGRLPKTPAFEEQRRRQPALLPFGADAQGTSLFAFDTSL